MVRIVRNSWKIEYIMTMYPFSFSYMGVFHGFYGFCVKFTLKRNKNKLINIKIITIKIKNLKQKWKRLKREKE